MKNLVLLFLLFVVVVTSIFFLKSYLNNRIDQDYIDSISKYESVVNMIINNSLWKEEKYISIYPSQVSIMFAASDAEKVNQLWAERLLETNSPIFIDGKSCITFRIKFDSGFINSLGHYIVYIPANESCYLKNGHSEEVLKERKIKEGWSYLIVRHFWD